MSRSPSAQRRHNAVLCAVAAAGLAAMLGGCNTTFTPDYAVYPQDYRERHPITVREGARTVEVFISRNRGGLSPSQRADVLAFAQAWNKDGTSGVVIDVPNGHGLRPSADVSLREIRSILAASGVPAKGIRVRTYGSNDPLLSSIKLSYTQIVAKAGPCGEWPADLGPTADSYDFLNLPYWNLGCASQRNLASMVDNPADLVQPRGEGPAYQARRTVMMDKYRKGENPTAQYPNDQKNSYDNLKITDMAK